MRLDGDGIGVARIRTATVIVLFGSVLLGAYLYLTTAGHWQADEYETFHAISKAQFGFVVNRVVHWSPRPLSELSIFVYAKMVMATRAPMIAPVLLATYLLLIICTVAPWLVFRRQQERRLTEALAVPLALVCLYLLGRATGELFYWPMGSLAYVPVLAAAGLLFGLIENDQVDRRPYTVMSLLLLAAMSAEVGAMLAIVYITTLLLARWFLRGQGERPPARPIGELLPLAVAIVVLFRILVGRVAAGNDVVEGAGIVHQFLPSVRASIPRTLYELIAMDGQRSGVKNIFFGATTKLAYLVGMVGLALSRSKKHVVSPARVAFITASLAMIPLTIFAAFYQYGSECCERHASLRQCLVFLALGSMAACIALGLRRCRRPIRLDATMALSWSMRCLLLALVLAAWQSSGRLKHDLRSASALRASQAATWASGQQAGPSMVVTQHYPGEIVGGNGVHIAGTYALDTFPPEEIPSMLRYFGKKEALLTSPVHASGRQR